MAQTYVAENTSTGTQYENLLDALYDATAGQTVKMLADIDITAENKTTAYCAEIITGITLDGNGKTLTVERYGISIAPLSNDAKARRTSATPSSYDFDVTIKDITIQNTAAQYRGRGGRCIQTRGKLGTLTLDNVTLTTDGSSYTQGTLMPLVIGGNQNTAATVNVNNSQIITDAAGAKGYAITTYNPFNLNITSSTLTAQRDINFAEADESAGSNGSTVTISASTLTATGAALYFNDGNTAVDITSTDINANTVATFGSTTENIVSLTGADNTVTYTTLTDAADNTSLSIAGGQFNAVVADDYLAEGYICHKVATSGKYLVEEGTYKAQIGDVNYPNLSEAVACANAGETITMIADDRESLTSEGAEVTIDKAITITGAVDSNGVPLYTIYGSSDGKLDNSNYNDLFVRCATGTVTISNLKFDGFGNAISSKMGRSPILVSTSNNDVVLDNIHITNLNCEGIHINGGTFAITNCNIDCSKTVESVFTKGICIVNAATGSITGTISTR